MASDDKRFVLRRGDWVLGAWTASGEALLLRLIVVRRKEGWRGQVTRIRQQGRTRQHLTGPVELEEEYVAAICDEIVNAHLDAGDCVRAVRVDVKSDDMSVVKRRLSLLTG